MYITQCVLTMLALYVGVVQSFSWDIVISRGNRLEFYDEGNLTYSVIPSCNNIHWITYDPFHNRVLFTETVSTPSKPVFSFDIATGKAQTLINLKRFFWKLVYDPARELLFANFAKSMESFLVKPGSDPDAKGNHLVDLKIPTKGLAVDSCRGYIYWTTERLCTIEKVLFNGSEREAIKDGCKDLIKSGLAIDTKTQKIYWAENQNKITEFFSADLNGNDKKSLYKEENIEVPQQISVAKDFIYWVDTTEACFWQLPKNTSSDTDVKPKRFPLDDTPTALLATAMASNYVIEEQTLGNPDCKALKSLLPSNPTKHESRASGDTCDVAVCHNYCLQGNCSVNAEGQPKCRCNAGYSGQRCEVDACLGHCLNEGVCSLNEKSLPVCRCSGGYEGDRCDASVFLTKFVQHFVDKTASMLNDVLNEDGVTDCKGAKSTCASTGA